MTQILGAPALSLSSFLTVCIGIFALLDSLALAQVNGPGPSPSSEFDTVLNLPGDEPPINHSAVYVGGVPGQTTQINISDGSFIDRRFIANAGSEVNISGGSVGTTFSARSGSEVNLSGGAVVLRLGSDPFSVEPFSADSGSNVNISGGVVNPRFNARNGSLVNISGGLLYRLTVSQDSEVSISGGSFGRLYSPGEDTDIELIGGEFRLNGEDLDSSDSRIILAVTDTLTGTLADGSAFIFDGALHGVTLTAADLPTADLSPITVNSAVVSGPSGVRAGQTLTLQAGGSLRDNFAVVDAALNVEDGELADFAKAFKSVVNLSGGSIGESFYALDSVVDITGGTVGYGFRASGSEVNISGGSVGNRFDADAGSVVNISGGTVGSFFSAGTESVINISGGAIDDHLNASSGSEVNITGGPFGDSIRVTGGEVNLFGSEFQIDGAVLDTLLPGETFTIADRDITLSGVLADGTPFSFDLIGQSLSDNFFSPTATLTVTIAVPFLLGDCNEDGVVNVSDISSFIAILQSGSFLAQADCNQDDLVNFADISAFIGIILNL